MFSDRSRGLPVPLALLLVSLAGLAVGCGHKKPPIPPPLKQPQAGTIVLEQRGSEAFVTFAYPTLTVSGTALSGVERIELWRLQQEVPAFALDIMARESLARERAEALLLENGLGPTGLPLVPIDPETGLPITSPIDPLTGEPAAADSMAAEPAPGEPTATADPASARTGEATTEAGGEDAEGEGAETEEEELDEELQADIDAAVTLLRSPERSIEEFLSATPDDFRAEAEMIAEIESEAISAAVVGESIVLRTDVPLPERSMDELVAELAEELAAEEQAAEQAAREAAALEESAEEGAEENEEPTDPAASDEDSGELFSHRRTDG